MNGPVSGSSSLVSAAEPPLDWDLMNPLLASISDVVVILSADGVIQYSSPSANPVWGETPDQLIGTTWWRLVQVEDLQLARKLLGKCLSAPADTARAEIRLQFSDGDCRQFEVVANNMLADSRVQGIVATFRDISDRKLIEDELTHRAFYDPVTGLPNRALFLNRLSHALTRASRHGSTVAVMFLDLDNFKLVNDSLGHEAGDELLCAIGERLQASLRSEDTAARLGGDEFTVLLEEVRDAAAVVQVAEHLTFRLRQPVRLAGRDVFITASLGIALNSAGDYRPDALLRNADLAMYQAKKAGKAQYQVFDNTMSADLNDRLTLDTELRHAISNGELEVYYQPVVNLTNGRINEVEALVRWRHPTRGLLVPGEFISHAEDTGLIIALGQRVLEDACRQATTWRRFHSGLRPLTVSVNLSTKQFRDLHLGDTINAVLQSTGLDARLLQLEITESATVPDPNAAAETLRRLRQRGVRVAVDDFGTGYSSLAHLRDFPIDVLKIDRSFVSGLGTNAKDSAIVQTIISLAGTLGLRVTGEGIETAEQLALLREFGCDQGQGFHFSRPVPAEQMTALLRDAQSMATRQGLTFLDANPQPWPPALDVA